MRVMRHVLANKTGCLRLLRVNVTVAVSDSQYKSIFPIVFFSI